MATLYKKCPKCAAEAAGLDVCAACGIIFAKYLRAKFAAPEPRTRRASQEPDEDTLVARARDPASGVRDFQHIQALAGRCGLAFLEDNAMPANNRLLVFKKKG